MARRNLKLLLITPERELLSEPAESVVIPAHDGELGILPGRAPLMCMLGVGRLRYTRERQTRSFYVDGGFAQVQGEQVVVLTPTAVAIDQIPPDMVTHAERQRDELRSAQGPDAAEQRFLASRRVSVLRALSAGR